MELGTHVRDVLVMKYSPRDSSHPDIDPAWPEHPSGFTVQVVYPFVEMKTRTFCAGVPTWSGNEDLPQHQPVFLVLIAFMRHWLSYHGPSAPSHHCDGSTSIGSGMSVVFSLFDNARAGSTDSAMPEKS